VFVVLLLRKRIIKVVTNCKINFKVREAEQNRDQLKMSFEEIRVEGGRERGG
jgi:hypothetical protein